MGQPQRPSRRPPRGPLLLDSRCLGQSPRTLWMAVLGLLVSFRLGRFLVASSALAEAGAEDSLLSQVEAVLRRLPRQASEESAVSTAGCAGWVLAFRLPLLRRPQQAPLEAWVLG